MNILRRCLIGIMLGASVCTVCYSESIASDFEQVLTSLRERATQARRSLYYHDVNDAVNNLVTEHSGASAVSFLEGKINEPNSRKLALLSLARLVTTGKTAQDAL